jgi:hypothetical protein
MYSYLSSVQKRRLKKCQAGMAALEEVRSQRDRLQDKAENEVLMLSLIGGLRVVVNRERGGKSWAVFITSPIVIRVVRGPFEPFDVDGTCAAIAQEADRA